jgi:hypothetical protein
VIVIGSVQTRYPLCVRRGVEADGSSKWVGQEIYACRVMGCKISAPAHAIIIRLSHFMCAAGLQSDCNSEVQDALPRTDGLVPRYSVCGS